MKIALTEGLCGRAPTYQPEEQQEIDALTRLLVDQVYNIYADPSADQTANIGTITDAIVPLIQNNAQSLITYIKTVKTDKQETPFEVTMQDQIATVTTALKNKLLENMGTS